jgi:hypothetical protein
MPQQKHVRKPTVHAVLKIQIKARQEHLTLQLNQITEIIALNRRPLTKV